jgi:1,4-dihydroxy-2-naphthoate polyprenyltransferase
MAARPKTLFASLSPVLLGLALSALPQINLKVALITICCALLLQVMSNLVNDYYDGIKGIDDGKRLGPKRAVASGALSPEKVKKATTLVSFIALMLGLYLMYIGGTPIIIVGLCSLLFAFLYTGGPLPLSHYGLGELLALIFFGPVAVAGTTYLQTQTFSTTNILIGFGPGLISSAVMAINNLRDRENDQQNGKFTLAVFLGEKKARLLVLFFVLASALPLALFPRPLWSFSLYGLFFFLFRKTWSSILFGPINKNLNGCLANTAKFLFLYCLSNAFLLFIPNF